MAGKRPRMLFNFVRIAKKDSRGLSHGDGWGYAVYLGDKFKIVKKLDPIWESFEPLPKAPFILHARRATKLERSLDHLHPHMCNGVMLAHNGNVSVPLIEGFRLSKRTSSEKLACYFGKLLEKYEVSEALKILVSTVKPKPSANFVAFVPSLRKLVVLNYHEGDSYYIMWKKEDLYSSEPLGRGWTPLSPSGEPVWEIVDL